MSKKIALAKRTGARSARQVGEFSSRAEMLRYLKETTGKREIPQDHYTYLTIDNRLKRL